MRTTRRDQIFKIIEKKGKIRPVELYNSLQLSRQLIHRHLRSLTDEGLIEIKGSAPLTHYVVAGVPDLEGVSKWVHSQSVPVGPKALVCETREAFAGRLLHLKSFLTEGLPIAILPLVISTAGEI